ncbi:MAG: hypothetical protein JWM89_1203 [Acidimicrobiales bacterium]|nr:hypothetical protein [Acidimicrobiales bacterium]
MIAVLDTGAVSALAPVDEACRARLRALWNAVDAIEVPAAVLAEGLLTGHPGRDHHVRRLLRSIAVIDIDEFLGLAAGRMRHRVATSGSKADPSGVDALVAAVADQRASVDDVIVITDDAVDLQALLAGATHTERVSITSV